FVFPSLTDTFGLVVLEAMSSGTPVAAFDATGPRDVIPGSGAGEIAKDLDSLAEAAVDCLKLDRARCREYAEGYSWRACAEAFLENLQPLPPPERKRFWQRIRLGRRRKAIHPPQLEAPKGEA
ncbi:MAG: glycosyltransferase, partial [Hyphomonadaceae bacterium]|nr:glycosyltransferase [Hyphomonadaceae bacterium]